MKQFALHLLLVLTSIFGFSQNPDRIVFEYDLAGNQIVRKLCITCQTLRSTNESIVDMTNLKNDDLLKFSFNDVISYFPNPVKEELFLKWELVNDNKVSNISIYSISGQLIRSIKEVEKENSKIISFSDYPEGTYSLLLFYTNGDQKSIVIIKN